MPTHLELAKKLTPAQAARVAAVARGEGNASTNHDGHMLSILARKGLIKHSYTERGYVVTDLGRVILKVKETL